MILTKISQIKQNLGKCIYKRDNTAFVIHDVHKLDLERAKKERAKKERAFKDSILELLLYLDGQDVYIASDNDKRNAMLFTETNRDDIMPVGGIEVGVL